MDAVRVAAASDTDAGTGRRLSAKRLAGFDLPDGRKDGRAYRPAGRFAAARAALAWADAVGLSVFCVLGAQAGLLAGAHWSIAILTGVMTAAFGGLLRDVLVNDVPLVLREEIYALAALRYLQ